MRNWAGVAGGVLIAAGTLLGGCSREAETRTAESVVTTKAEKTTATVAAVLSGGSPAPAATTEAAETTETAERGTEKSADTPQVPAGETTGSVVVGVVTLADGSPALGTTVSLGWPDAQKAQRMALVMTNEQSMVTGADGRFRLSADKKADTPMPLILKAERAKSATVILMVPPLELASKMGVEYSEKLSGGAIVRDITLAPAAAVRGRVVDENSRPIAGVTITAMPEMTPGPEMFTKGMHRGDAVSGEDGSFELNELAAGTYALMAEAKEHVPVSQSLSAPADEVTITMTRGGGSVAGHVYHYSTRGAVAGASVTLQMMPEGKITGRFMAPTMKQEETDQVGTFEFEGLGPGKYMISAMKGKWRQMPQETGPGMSQRSAFELGNGETTAGLALFLYPGHTITGMVRDSKSSTPLEGVTVSLAYQSDKIASVTDARGIFRLPGVFGSQANLQVEKKGYTLAGGRDPNRGSERPQVQLSMKDLEPHKVIDMTRSVTVSGIVKMGDGTPVGGAEVTAYTQNHNSGEQPKIKTDPSGAYEIDVQPFIQVRMKAEAKGYPPAVSAEMVEVFDEPVTGADIIIKPGISVSGRVTTFEGKAADKATVSASSYVSVGSIGHGVSGGQAQTDADGRFTINNVQPTEVSFTAKLKGYTDSESARADLSSGNPTSDIELVLRKSHFVAGRVTGPDDKPLPQAHVSANSQYGGGSHASGQTDVDGKYRLEGLAEGTVNIHVFSSGHGSEQRQDVKVDQENVDFQLGKKDAAKRSNTPETGVLFTGHVVDWKSGQPVSDFTLSGNNTQEAEKDPHHPGRILVKNYRSGHALQFLLEAPGYLPLDTGYFSPKEVNGKLEQTFRLGPGGSVTGRVLDNESMPLADVRVLLKGIGQGYEVNRRSPEQAVKTDADGRFRLERVSAGDNRLTVRGVAPLAEQDKTAKVEHGEVADLGDIVLTSGGRVTGRVLRAPGDTPMADVRVTISESMSGGNTKEARTDGNGAFEFAGLKNVQYNVSVPEYSLSNGFTQANDQTREIVLRVGGSTVRGRVLRGGTGVRGQVSLTEGDGNSRSSSTKLDGSYELKGVVAGTWQINAYSYGGSSGGSGGSLRETVEVPQQGEVEKDLVFPGGRIVGRVEDEEGKPVYGAQVAAQPPVGTGGATDSFAPPTVNTQSGSDGAFALDGLKEGTYGVTAQARSKMAIAPGVVVPANGESAPVVLRIGAGGGTIVSTALNMSTGAPIPEAWLILSNDQGRYQHGQTRGADGVLTVENVPAGPYSVQVSSYGFSINEHSIEVKEGETLRLDDVLYDAGALRWTIQSNASVGVAGARCRLVPDDPASIESPREGVTANDGLLIIRGLYPGVYTGTVTSPTGATTTEKISIDAHGLSTVITKLP